MGGWASQWQGKEGGMSKLVTGGAGVARPTTCSPRLTPGQTSPRSSGNSSAPHHCCPRMCYPDPAFKAAHTLVSAQEITATPPASATAPPCCLSVAQAPCTVCPSPPLVADCALWLAPAARCQDLFRERAGAGWAGEECAHILEHRENPAHLSTPTLPNSLLRIPTCCLPASISCIEQAPRIN